MPLPAEVTAERTADRKTQRNVYVFGATSFFNDTASEMAYWVLPQFLLRIGAGPAQLGIIEGIAESVAAIFKLFSGVLTDRITRRKPLVVGGYVVANAVKPLLAIVNSWWQVLGIRFADRTAKGIRSSPRDVMLAESTDPDKLGGAYGLLQSMDSAGAIAGPLLALLILRMADIRWVFWAAAIPGALSVLAITLFTRETGKRRVPATGKAESAASSQLSPAFCFVIFAVGIFSLGNSSDMFLVLRAQESGISPKLAPLLGLVFNTVYTAASWPAGKLSDRVSRRWVASAGYFVFALTYAAFAYAPGHWNDAHEVIWATMGLYGLYYALTQPVLKALVVDSVRPEARGRALGVFYFVTSIAALLSSSITGYLWKRFSGEVPLMISAAFALIAALMLLLYRERRPTPAS